MKAIDNLGNTYNLEQLDDIISVKAEEIPEEIEYIEINDEGFCARVGEEGYFVIADANGKGSRVCKFSKRADTERVFKQNLMPIFGVKKENSCILAIAQGLKYELSIAVGVKNNEYYIYPRFYLNGNKPYEDISIKFIKLNPDDGYSEMANAYRAYCLSKGFCTPLSERIKERESLRYAVQAPEIRIRMGWKPAPPQIMEQTVENEPPMKVVCTFDRVKDIIDELRLQGVDKGQICLVGWNKSGHDGRYPQLFPVEEKLGGEEKLRELISYAKENGYQIVCHTNSTDCYSIADTFSEDIVAKKKDGSLSVNEVPWSGGRMYNLCPIKALEYAKEDLPKVRELGFEGLHYIDVITVSPLRWCYDKNHPTNPNETLKYYNEIMSMSQKLFGGFASEGVYDFSAKYLDFGLYVAWPAVEDELFDYEIPLWAMVYHGIILYNPTTDTVNYPIKDKTNELKVIEHGGRPSFYFYSKFMQGSVLDDWLGAEDMVCETDEQLKFSVSKIKEAYEMYKIYGKLQTEFIIKHEVFEDNTVCVTYSDNTKIKIDYNEKTYKMIIG